MIIRLGFNLIQNCLDGCPSYLEILKRRARRRDERRDDENGGYREDVCSHTPAFMRALNFMA